MAVELLANRCGAHADSLFRVMRFLVSRGVFAEPTPRNFALNSRADQFRSDRPNSARWHFMHDLPARSAAGILYTVRTGAPAFPHLYGKSIWEHLAENPDENEWFNRHMRSQALALAMPVIAEYDWSRCNTVVDVGGGTGLFIEALLERHSHLTGVLVDQPHVVANIQQSERCRVVSGDFFSSVPATGDTYVLSRVLHDWNNEDALRILQTVRTAMPSTARLLILEMVVPEDSSPHPSKMLDVAMLLQFGGRERTERQFAELITAARLRFTGISATTGPTSILEAIPK